MPDSERQQRIRLKITEGGNLYFYDCVKHTAISDLQPTWVGGVSNTITTVAQRASCVTYYEIDKP